MTRASLSYLPSPHLVFSMHPATRTPVDGLNDVASFEAGLTCPLSEDLARQEDFPDTDILTVLRRFGVGRHPVAYGEADYDTDLLQARLAYTAAMDAISGLPAPILDAHGGPEGAWAAFQRGELRLDQDPPEGAAPPRPEEDPDKAPEAPRQ